MALLDRNPGGHPGKPGERDAHFPDQSAGENKAHRTHAPSETRNKHNNTRAEDESSAKPERGRARKMVLGLGGVAALAAAAGVGVVNSILGPSEDGKDGGQRNPSASAPRVVLPPVEATEAAPTHNPDSVPMPEITKPRLDYVPSNGEKYDANETIKAMAEQFTWAANNPDETEDRIANLFRNFSTVAPTEEGAYPHTEELVTRIRNAAIFKDDNPKYHATTYSMRWLGEPDQNYLEGVTNGFSGSLLIRAVQTNAQNSSPTYERAFVIEKALLQQPPSEGPSMMQFSEIHGFESIDVAEADELEKRFPPKM